MRIPSGKTDQVIYFVAVDITDLKTRETGLSSFTVYRSRNGGAATAYTTPTVTELSSANMPGVYSLLIDEDTTIASGSDSEEYCVHITQASMAPVTRTIELYRRDTTTGTTITVANGCADADIERLQGNVIATPTVSGVLEVDVTHFNGVAGTFASGRPEVNTTHIAGSAVNTSSAQLGVNVVNAGGTAWGSGAITAASIATGAIDADALAADAVTEIWAGSTAPTAATIADAVWDEDATAHQTQGTFGQAIGDPAADTNTIYKAVVTDATGATVGVDVVAIKAETSSIQTDTNGIQTRLPAALVSGRMDSSVGAMATDVMTSTALAASAVTEIQAGLSTLDAAGVRSAVGLAAANLDTQLSTIDTVADAIKAKTDSLAFTVAGQVDANIQYVNDVQVSGDGQTGTEWGPA